MAESAEAPSIEALSARTARDAKDDARMKEEDYRLKIADAATETERKRAVALDVEQDAQRKEYRRRSAEQSAQLLFHVSKEYTMLGRDEKLPWEDYGVFWQVIPPSISLIHQRVVEKCFGKLDGLVRAARVKNFSATHYEYCETRLSKLSAGAVVDFIHTVVHIPRTEV
ncbi:unnamed protein product [Pylaiella littoralis]